MTDILTVLPSPDDGRDRIGSPSADLPVKVSLDIWEVDDQKQHGSCLANAVTSALEIYEKRKGKGRSLSRMYAYWWIRALAKRQGVDGGGFPRDMCKAINRFGICDESLYQYDAANLFKVPSEDAIISAISNAEYEYERIPLKMGYATIDDHTQANTTIKSYLAQGIPVLLTLSLDSNFTKDCVGPWQTHSWHVTNKPAEPGGGHEVLIVGYDDTPEVKRFEVLNSWGTQWGDNGKFGLMYQPMKSKVWQSLCIRELWVVKPKG